MTPTPSRYGLPDTLSIMLASGKTESFTGVELLQVGTWPAMTGDVTVTEEDIHSIIEAAGDDGIPAAPLKRGHIDPRNDGEPAIGWVENLSAAIRRGRLTLLGDYVGVPISLAENLPSMYRNRSVEIEPAKSRHGKAYRMVLKAVALLGATPPAVTTLADIAALSQSEHNEATQVLVVEGDVDMRSAAALAAARASVLAFAAATGLDEKKALETLDSMVPPTDGGNVPPTGTGSGNDGDQPGGGTVSLTDDKLREMFGLKEGEDIEAQLASIAKAKAEADGGENKPKEGEGGEPKTAEAPKETGKPADGEGVNNAGNVTISQETLDKLIADAGRGAAAADKVDENDREKELVAFAAAGKVSPAELKRPVDKDGNVIGRSHIEELLIAAPDATRAMLSARPAQYATVELGSDAGEASQGSHALSAADDAEWDKFYAQMGIETETGK